MSRISIDVTREEHQRLKALAAIQGKSIKEYVLERTLAAEQSDEQTALIELETILDQRIRRAESGDISNQTVQEIFEEVFREEKV